MLDDSKFAPATAGEVRRVRETIENLLTILEIDTLGLRSLRDSAPLAVDDPSAGLRFRAFDEKVRLLGRSRESLLRTKNAMEGPEALSVRDVLAAQEAIARCYDALRTAKQ